MIWRIGGDYPPTSKNADAYTFALLARTVFDFMRMAFCGMLYLGIPFGIYDDETPVGFCMIGFGTDDDWEDAPDIARSNYNLWRFMIDERYQGKGYGRAAMKQIVDYIASEPCGPAEYCWLSYEPENAAYMLGQIASEQKKESSENG